MISRRTALLAFGAAGILPARALRAAETGGPVVVPISIGSGRLLVDVVIGAGQPLAFAIDTGALVGLIREDMVRPLGLKSAGEVALGGSTGKVARYPLYIARDVLLGGALRTHDVQFAVTREGFGEGVDGTLGSELVTSYDSVIDFDRGEWRVYPDAPPARTGFVQLPSSIRRGSYDRGSPYLFIEASLDGRPYRFMLDTGLRGAMMLNPSGVTKSGLWTDDRPFSPLRPSGLGGAGGVGRLVRGGEVEIGGAKFDRPLIRLVAPGAPDGLADGVIGLSLLRRMNLMTDVKAGKLWIQPSRLAYTPERNAVSGLWLDPARDGARVRVVGKGSPAEAAGIRRGDDLTGASFETLVREVNGPPGREVTLIVGRDGQRRKVVMKLADYL